MRRSFAAVGLVLAIAGGAASMSIVPSEATQAAAGPGQTFVVPANDGYGIADCVASGSTCGKVVADAWCEAQGFRRSASIGPVEVETTGAIGTAGQPIAVTCSQ